MIYRSSNKHDREKERERERKPKKNRSTQARKRESTRYMLPLSGRKKIRYMIVNRWHTSNRTRDTIGDPIGALVHVFRHLFHRYRLFLLFLVVEYIAIEQGRLR